MKNVQLCPNCNAENPIYKYSCTSCKAFLRARVVNIDLWQTIAALIESPKETFKKIIEAEHKNFVIFLNVLVGIKLFLISVILHSFAEINSVKTDFFFINLLVIIGVSFVVLSLFSYLLTKINSLFSLLNRFRDNYSILIYSFLPLLMSLVILSPVHYALFGPYWFTYNPPPYIVKETEAYILLFIEGLLVVWGLFLVISGVHAQTNNKLYSIAVGCIFYVLLAALLYYIPFLPLS
ncbi:MAG: hypothetical protein C4543_06800 [Ignavibacteriales bacterium]|jgi:hypothetical protein|nr:MAG: hypothetical protein C4543_06800 [Ignavibacteriales bacterium]